MMQLYVGQVLDQLRKIPDDSVHLIITSPPYWKVRDYGMPGQLGQEETLAEHIANLVEISREWRRVLHPKGTLWLNYGDLLAQNGTGMKTKERIENHKRAKKFSYGTSNFDRPTWGRACGTARGSGLAVKQLLLIPEQLALAIRSDGWTDKTKGFWLRSQIIWNKGNSGAESIKDRPSRDHEMIYVFSKSPRYFYDVYAVRNNPQVIKGWTHGSQLRTVWKIPATASRSGHPATFPLEIPRRAILLGTSRDGVCPHCLTPVIPQYELGPPDLAAQIRMGANANGTYEGRSTRKACGGQDPSERKSNILKSQKPFRYAGPAVACKCIGSPDNAIPATVLDPFSGEGTTGRAALDNGRSYIGIELNADHAAYQRAWLEPTARALSELVGVGFNSQKI